MTNFVHNHNSENTQDQNSVSSEKISHALNALRTEEEKLVVALRKQASQERVVRDLASALDAVVNMVEDYKAGELCTDHEEEETDICEYALDRLKDHIAKISEYVTSWAEATVETTRDTLAEQRALIAKMVEGKA